MAEAAGTAFGLNGAVTLGLPHGPAACGGLVLSSGSRRPKVPDRFADSLCEKGGDSQRNLVIDDFFDRCDYPAPGRSPSLRTSFARSSERRARDLANGAFDDSNQSGRKVRAQWLNQFYASRT